MSRDRPFLGNGFQFPRLCNALRFLLGIGLVSAASLLGAAAPIPDTDGDGVPDGVERWLARAGAPVSPVISNVYADGDGDFIPDLVEIYLTRTSPTESDSSVCTGGGAPVDLTGQFDTRTAANLANPINVLTDEVSALSVCHTGTLLRVYSPRYGYADNTSLTGAGPYTFSATWNNGPGVLDDVAISGTCPLPCTAPNLVITGTTTTSGAARPTTLTRRTQLTYLITFEVNGPVFGAQVVVDPKPTNPSASNASQIGSESFQMANGGSGGPSRLDHKNASLPGYFVPSVGTYFFAHYEVETIPTGLSSTETLTTYSRFSMTFTDSPSGGVGGMFRGVVDWIEDSNVNPTSVGLDTLYGKAQLPQTGGITRNTGKGPRTILYFDNVPISADAAFVAGPGLPQTKIFDDYYDSDPQNDKRVVVKHRSRIPAFTDGEQVGLAGNGSDLNVSDASYVHSTTLPSGTYSIEPVNGYGYSTAFTVQHVDRSFDLLPVVTGVSWDNVPLTTLNGIDMSLAHTLRWNAVTTGGIGNNGVGNNSVGVYRIVISAPDGGELDYPFTSSNSVNRFLLPPGANCAGGGTCSWVIPANTLGSNEGYIVQIEARDDSDANNRSITRKFALNVPVTDTYGAVLPVSRSVQVGQTATAFATILNAGSSPAYDCAIAPITSIPADFSYQTTDPLTNAVIGQPNTPVNLDVGGAQTFVFAFTPTAPVSPTDVQLEFKCLNSDAAPIYANVNTLLFSADSSPVPDVIALAATSNNDGIVNIPGSIGTGFFAVATANVGAASTITASADTGAATLPVTLWLCQTNPGTGACLAPLTPTVTTTIGAGETPTFAVFVAGSGSVPFDPANNRVIVRFRDGANVVRGATSVAVRSQ